MKYIFYFLLSFPMLASGLVATPAPDQVSAETENRNHGVEPSESSTPVNAAIAEQARRANASVDKLTGQLDKLAGAFESLEKKRSELMTGVILKSSEKSFVDFSKDHDLMLERLDKSVDLSVKYKDVLDQFKILQTKVTELVLDPAVEKSEVKPKYDKLKVGTSDGVAACETSYNDLMEYRSSINATLIESVHTYQVRNHFRIWIGFAWFFCFLLIASGALWLFKRGILGIHDSNSLQLVAMVMIIFVVMLFGITDVMGENGVTGILAAIAGYILGKSSVAITATGGTSDKEKADKEKADKEKADKEKADKEKADEEGT